jgi:two-component system, cell cycle sensor histidine kinase and response regulator CckA
MNKDATRSTALVTQNQSTLIPLRVLILEDNPRDVEVCIRVLSDAGFEVQADIVDNGEGFAAKLYSKAYDIILSDHNIPSWSGKEAFLALKKSGKGIPFILVTGTLGDEAAVDLIKEGVADYVLKERLVRLAPAVRRAIAEKQTSDERERALCSLRQSEERIRLLLNSTAEAIYGIDLQGNCTFANPRCALLLGYDKSGDLLGKQMHWLMHHTRGDGEKYPIEECPIYTASRTNQGTHVDDEVLWRKDGSSFPAEYWSYPILQNEKPIGAVVTFIDITERKKAAETIRKERDRAQQYLDIADVILLALDLEGRITLINRKGCSTLGWEERELIGRDWINTCLPARTRKELRESLYSLLSGNLSYIENPILTKSGEERMIGWRNTLLRDGAGRIIGTLSSGEDITERKQAEEALRKSEARVRRLVESNIIGIAIGDLNGRLIDANDAFCGLLGFTREGLLSGHMRWDQLTPPEYRNADQDAVELLRKTGVAPPWEKEFFRKNGTRVSVLIGVVSMTAQSGDIEAVSFVVDISERKLLEKRLRQAQKMEAIGQLTGGIAHDFNNLLGVIIGYSEILGDRLPENDPLRPKAEQIRKAGRRAAALTRQLLAFSRQQVLDPKILGLNAVVADTLKMLQRLIGEDIELVTVPAQDLGLIEADQGQIEQIIMNLAVNARDAMPQGGKLTITTANAEIDDIYARQCLDTVPGSYVMLAMSDTGCGMDEETQTRIFEPFFTTKEEGKGTGLGLSTVYGVVKQSGGYTSVYSEVGLGTTFKIYFPRIKKTVSAALPNGGSSKPLRGWETILLAEDALPLRELTRELLEEHGYTVLEAANGADAIRLAEKHREPIHLLLSDVVMPGMGGRELAESLVRIHPETKVLYMSGYLDDAIIRHGVLDAEIALLQKPFTKESLTHKVREALGINTGSKPEIPAGGVHN